MSRCLLIWYCEQCSLACCRHLETFAHSLDLLQGSIWSGFLIVWYLANEIVSLSNINKNTIISIKTVADGGRKQNLKLVAGIRIDVIEVYSENIGSVGISDNVVLAMNYSRPHAWPFLFIMQGTTRNDIALQTAGIQIRYWLNLPATERSKLFFRIPSLSILINFINYFDWLSAELENLTDEDGKGCWILMQDASWWYRMSLFNWHGQLVCEVLGNR